MRGLIARLAGGGAYQPDQEIEVGGWTVRLKVSPRSSRIALRIDRDARLAVASAPSQRRLVEAVQFAHSRAAWIGQRLSVLPPPLALTPGVELRLFGQAVRLEALSGRARLDMEAGLLSAPADAAFGARAVRLIKAEARRRFTERTQYYAQAMGRPQPTVSVVDPRRRWGSCSPPRRGGPASIRYSWRLALAPWEVADYVVAHECAHLAEPNHGPRFWAKVDELYGECAKAKAWLRLHGDRLHAVTI